MGSDAFYIIVANYSILFLICFVLENMFYRYFIGMFYVCYYAKQLPATICNIFFSFDQMSFNALIFVQQISTNIIYKPSETR